MVNSSSCVQGEEVWGWWKLAWPPAVRSGTSQESSCVPLGAVGEGNVFGDKHVQCREEMERFTFSFKAKTPSLSPTVHQCVEVRATIHNSCLFAWAREGRLSGSGVRAGLFPEAPVSVCADSMESFQAMIMWHPLLASRKIHDMVSNGPAWSAKERGRRSGALWPWWWLIHSRDHIGSKTFKFNLKLNVKTISRMRRWKGERIFRDHPFHSKDK